MYMAMVLFAVAVLGRIVFLQFVAGEQLESEVKKASVKMEEVKAPLGTVYSDNAKKTSLALSAPRYDVFMDLTVASEELFDESIIALSDSLGVLFAEQTSHDWELALREARKNKRQYFKIRKDVLKQDVDRLTQFPIFEKGQYKGGVIVKPKNIRVNPYGDLALRTIGYYNDKGSKVTAVGIEGAYSKYLQGEDGQQLMEKSGGGWRPIKSDLSKISKPGADVYVSLDINLQDVADNALRKQMRNQDALWGSVVLMEVETGFVKAIVNLQKDTTDGTYEEDFNHAIGTATEPGSTFKLASLMVALDDGKIRITDSVNMPGKYCYYGSCLHDSKHGGYGKGTVQYAFEKSSNVVSQIINDNYGQDPQKFINGLKDIGLHKKLGVDLIGEDSPYIKDANDETFSGISIPWMSIGYEVEQTPLQTLAFYNAVANDGVMLKPQFVKEIRNGNEVVKKFEPEVLNPSICKKSTLRDVRTMLEGVVKRGTARNIRAKGFDIAGKTGTAKVAKAGTYSDKYQASFVGYFPAKKPKYSCVVVIQGPTRQIYGAQVSGTVFKEIADKVYAMGSEYDQVVDKELLAQMAFPYSKNGSKIELKSVFEQMGVPLADNASRSSYAVTKAGFDKVHLDNRIIGQDKVANVVGMGLVDALFLLESQGLVVQAKGSGVVVNQTIQPGSELEKGSLIELVLK